MMNTQIHFTVIVNEDVEDDADYLLSQIVNKRAVVDVEGLRFFGEVDAHSLSEITDLLLAVERQIGDPDEQRRLLALARRRGVLARGALS